MKYLSTLLMALVFCGNAGRAADPIQAISADGDEIVLNAPGTVTVVMNSSSTLQQRTRDTGKALYEFQGRKDFRVIVVVDLRGSMANLAKGYATRRIREDLDEEAKRVKPFFEKNGNFENPRPRFSAFADFKGDLCRQLGWEKYETKMRVIIFDQRGEEHRRWKDLGTDEYGKLAEAVRKLLPGFLNK
jgi:hypothetical protein